VYYVYDVYKKQIITDYCFEMQFDASLTRRTWSFIQMQPTVRSPTPKCENYLNESGKSE